MTQEKKTDCWDFYSNTKSSTLLPTLSIGYWPIH